MAHDYKISDFGLKLIKAYEGFRPIETVLVSGQRVIGYGHEFVPGEISVITKKKATDVLKVDLEPFEEMVNYNIFAPLSQNQFDALVSLSFNIGEDAFLNSSVVHNMNNGQPLAAAAGFDEWRKSVIADQTYVVDALVRRRTAEKALFLSPATGVVAAPRNELPPLHDSTAKPGTDDLEVFNTSDARGYVDQTPYDAEPGHNRRREDGPSGILTLSERASEPQIYDDIFEDNVNIDDVVETSARDTEVAPETNDLELETGAQLSPIALAAAEVSERLDNLMAENADAPESLNENFQEDFQRALPKDGQKLDTQDITMSEPLNLDLAADKTAVEEAAQSGITTNIASNDSTKIEHPAPEISESDDTSGIGAYWTALVVGLLLLGGALWKLNFSTVVKLDEMSAFLAPVAMLIGGMMVLGGLYYLLKAQLHRMTS